MQVASASPAQHTSQSHRPGMPQPANRQNPAPGGLTKDQGIAKLHSSSHTPCKGAAREALCVAEKKAERALAAVRVRVEQATRRLKCFRILGERYRNRRRRFGLRLHLIAGIVNYELV